MKLYDAKVIFEANIETNGYCFLTIYGKHANGYFCCIPNWFVGCEMAEPSDTYFNSCKLYETNKIDYLSAGEIARRIEIIAKNLKEPDKKTPFNEALAISRQMENASWYSAKQRKEESF